MAEASGLVPAVTVVIPVYNVEKYLDRCVQSVLDQTLENIEIILVDDGSTDKSGKLCDAYAEDARVKVIHQANGGLSAARNTGVGAAAAPYVGFVDSDDHIEKDMYALLYGLITEEKADIALCGIYDCYASGTKLAYAKGEGRFTADRRETVRYVLHGQLASVCAVNKLYKKELLKKHPFPIGKTSEDAHFIIPYLTDIHKAAFDLSPKYYYMHREGTITTRPYTEKDLSILEAYQNNRRIVQEQFPDLTPLADFRYYWAEFYILDKMLNTHSFGEKGEYKRLIRELRRQYPQIVKNPYVGKARKLAVSGLMLHPSLYKLCLRAYVKQRKQLISA